MGKYTGGECCACGFNGGVWITEHGYGDAKKEHKHCDFCEGSYVGSVCKYPRNSHEGTIHRTLSQLFNVLFKKLKAGGGEQ